MAGGDDRAVITYRLAEKEESPAVAALAAAIWREHYTPLIGPEQVEYMLDRFQSGESIARDIEKGLLYYLAEDGNVPAGYMALRIDDEGLFLSKLYVEKSYRGRGIARRFVEMAVRVAQENALPRIRLTVNKGNAGSIAAYRRMGFATVESVVSDIGSGFAMDDYIMELRVGT
jgi:ribosomal protein S18 acetylase RimI-like enzyme